MTRINHNIEAMVAQRAMRLSERSQSSAMYKLSTGLQINRAADDPANLSVSEHLRMQVRGSRVASRNAEDATSLIQIAEGALNEVASILQRMRELSVQSANDTVTSADRTYIDQEFQGLKEELDRIASQTQYNGMQLLSGTMNAFGSVGGPSVLHIGTNNRSRIDTLTVSIESVSSGALALISSNVLDAAASVLAIGELDSAIYNVNQSRSYLGAISNRLESTLTNLSIQEVNSQSADSVIRDADFAKLVTEMTRFQILNQSGTAMLGQANSLPKSVLDLFNR